MSRSNRSPKTMGNRKSKATKQGYESGIDEKDDDSPITATKDEQSRAAANEGHKNGETVKDRRNSDDSVKDEGSPNVAPISNKFGIKLYRTISKEQKKQNNDDNCFFSPVSIGTALAMTYKGARGDTAKQMDKAMKLASLSEDAFPNLSSSLFSSDQYQMKVASRLYGQRGTKFYLKFLASNSHGVDLETVDFVNGYKATTTTINTWVEDQTSGKIQDILAPGVLSSDTRLVLVDAIYFHCEWMIGFDPEATKESPFQSISDSLTVPMMHSEGTFQFYYDDDLNCKILSMPYKAGQVSMIIALPDDIKDLKDLEEDLDEDKLKSWSSKLKPAKCQVTIPKYTFTKSVSLVPFLKKMGITDLFQDGKADLSGIAKDDSLPVSDIIHKAVLTIDENGPEADTATAIPDPEDANFAYTSIEVFKADHPFVVIIYDQASEAVIFMGSVKRPDMK